MGWGGLGADPPLRVILLGRHANGVAVVIVPHTHASQGLTVDDVMLVVFAAAFLQQPRLGIATIN